MEAETVVTEHTPEGITIITIDRKRRRNAVDDATARKLYDAFLAFEDDSSQKVCILYGAHGTFCAGADLHAFSAPGEAVSLSPTDSLLSSSRRVSVCAQGPMGPSRMQPSKPVISAVAGYAVAGGLELSLIGDIRVVEENAIFGVFCRRWGVPLIDGGTVRLQAIIGIGRALDMILTGRPVNAQEAHTMGLANRVVQNGMALAEAMVIARQLLKFPQECMRADRLNCYYSAYNASSFSDALSNEFDNGTKVLATESFAGAARFSRGAGRHGEFGGHSKL